MSIKIDKSLILNEIKLHYSLKNDADFARFLNIKPQTLSSWYSRNTFDIDLLYSKCVDISGDWLLSGKGEMLKISNKNLSVDEPNPIRDKLIARQDQLIERLEEENKNLKQEITKLKKEKEPSFYTGMVAEDREKLSKKIEK